MFGIDEMWMRFEPRWPEAYSTYVGGREAKSAPQIAIPKMRPADTSASHYASQYKKNGFRVKPGMTEGRGPAGTMKAAFGMEPGSWRRDKDSFEPE